MSLCAAPDTYGKEPGLELRTGGCFHPTFYRKCELEHETRLFCIFCGSVLPRRCGFWSGGRKGRERAERKLAGVKRKAEQLDPVAKQKLYWQLNAWIDDAELLHTPLAGEIRQLLEQADKELAEYLATARPENYAAPPL